VSILQKASSPLSSRRQIGIHSVQDGIMTLPNNEFRSVLRTSSINFELRSDSEQDSLMEAYKGFLNSLPCPIQILFKVREMNVDKYLEDFYDKTRSETSKIYSQQLINYTKFIKSMARDNKILTRHFYIIIPFNSKEPIVFEVAKERLQLYQNIVLKGLERLGMKGSKLSSLEVLDLFYGFYNPEQSRAQPITERTLELLKQAYI
jgi:hypothetical protein